MEEGLMTKGEKSDFASRFLVKYQNCPRAKIVDLEVDGLRSRSLLKNGISPREGVYEFELFRRDCVTTPKDWDSQLTSSILAQVLYGLGWPDKPVSTERKISRLKQWLSDFKRIGSKYGDYSWLDETKITELIAKTLGLARREMMIELGL